MRPPVSIEFQGTAQALEPIFLLRNGIRAVANSPQPTQAVRHASTATSQNSRCI